MVTTWLWCSSRSRIAAASTSSPPKTRPQESKGTLVVSVTDVRLSRSRTPVGKPGATGSGSAVGVAGPGVAVAGAPVVALVTVPDLMGVTRLAFSRSFDFQTYLWAALLYLALVESFERAGRALG